MIGDPISKQLISFLVILLLAGCGLPASPAARAVQQADVQGTQAAFLVQTEIARPTRTPTPSPTRPPTETLPPPTQTVPVNATQTLLAKRVTPQPGMELYTHPEIADYVFEIDPTTWEKDPNGQTGNLVHKTIAGCQVASVPGHGLGAPERLLWQDFGHFRWQILDFGANAYVVPVLGAGLAPNQTSFLDLQGYNRRDCRTDQEALLASLMTRSGADGEVRLVPFLSPTPRPPLEGFDCPDTPPARLRVGDQLSIITDGLWLRSEPRADTSTKLRQYLRNAPYMIRVIGGPVCEKYVYWQVEVGAFGEGAETIQGWLAEGDSEEYYVTVAR